MKNLNNVGSSSDYWFQQPGSVDHWFYGVFEGGGAKGVAYSGALFAMKTQKCWFRGVAGASAGAITAMLIAAGIAPEEIVSETRRALKSIQTGFWEGLYRLYSTTGFLNAEALHQWIKDLLRKQYKKKTGSELDIDVTFEMLFEVTQIELNVVAADLSLKQQIVFSHWTTPDCTVADAVVASCSIPFAFPSRIVSIMEYSRETGKYKDYGHTIVDGGVWSNFPLFIFTDSDFRRHYGLNPDKLEQTRVLGFLLKEDEPTGEPDFSSCSFRDPQIDRDLLPREWRKEPKEPNESSPRIWTKLGIWILYPFSLLGRFWDTDEIDRGRWPQSSSKIIRYLVDIINGVLGHMSKLMWIFFTCGIVLVLVMLGTTQIIICIQHLYSTLSTLEPREFLVVNVSFFIIAIIFLNPVVFYVFIILIIFMGIFANAILLPAVRRILYGLVTTYVSGPGAPNWVAKKENVILLPIPRDISTLTFEISPPVLQHVIERAYNITVQKLVAILAAANRATGTSLPVEDQPSNSERSGLSEIHNTLSKLLEADKKPNNNKMIRPSVQETIFNRIIIISPLVFALICLLFVFRVNQSFNPWTRLFLQYFVPAIVCSNGPALVLSLALKRFKPHYNNYCTFGWGLGLIVSTILQIVIGTSFVLQMICFGIVGSAFMAIHLRVYPTSGNKEWG